LPAHPPGISRLCSGLTGLPACAHFFPGRNSSKLSAPLGRNAASNPPANTAYLVSTNCFISPGLRTAGDGFCDIGGRQGAFEWAALMCETGVDQIHLCYRHDSPEFTPSDWSWIDPSVVWPLLWNYDRGAYVSKVDWPIHCCLAARSGGTACGEGNTG
jgi:hypothetical protein